MHVCFKFWQDFLKNPGTSTLQRLDNSINIQDHAYHGCNDNDKNKNKNHKILVEDYFNDSDHNIIKKICSLRFYACVFVFIIA